MGDLLDAITGKSSRDAEARQQQLLQQSQQADAERARQAADAQSAFADAQSRSNADAAEQAKAIAKAQQAADAEAARAKDIAENSNISAIRDRLKQATNSLLQRYGARRALFPQSGSSARSPLLGI